MIRTAQFGMFALVIASFAARHAAAGGGDVKVLPFSQNAAVHGVRLHVNNHWVEGNGLRPLRLEMRTAPPGPTLRDRVFSIELRLDDNNYYSPEVVLRGQLILPEGNSIGRVIIPVPQTTSLQRIHLNVYEGGVRLPELCDTLNTSRVNRRNHTENRPSALFIASKAPSTAVRTKLLQQVRQGREQLQDVEIVDWRPLTQLYNYRTKLGGNQRLEPYRLLELAGDMNKFEVLGFEDLPEQWSLYSCFDMIFVSQQELKALIETEPRRWQALRRWISTGATLYVHDVGRGFERRAELSELLELHERDGVGGWRVPKIPPVNYVISSDANAPMNQSMALSPGLYEEAKELRMRQLGLGVVVAIGRKQPFHAPRKQQAALFNATGPKRWSWAQRNGLSLSRRNAGFWRRLIPGVGTPPVNTFLVTMTAFAIVVGPLNYFLLYRKRRLYLLFVTFPAAAFALTVGLMIYALVTDGFSARIRVRGVTYLDAQRKEFTSTSWQTYYAALAPSDGLVFPRQAIVFPVSYWRASTREDRNSQVITDWGREQRLRQGYLKSPVMTQFFVQHAGPTGMRLEVKTTGERMEIVNRLNSRIRAALVRHQNKFYFVENVAAGASAAAQPMDAKAAKNRMEPHYKDLLPELPEGFDPNTFQAFSTRRYYYGDYIDQEFIEPNDMEGILEKTIAALLLWPDRSIAEGNFAAIVDDSNAPVGIPNAERQTGGEVIVGEASR